MRGMHEGRSLILRPHAVAELQGEEQVKFEWGGDALSVTLKGPFLRLAEKFATAQDAQKVAESFAPQVDTEITSRAIERLIDAGVLVDSAMAEWETSARGGLFGAPVLSVHAAVTGDADVIVVGVPYDAGTTYRPGARFGPQAIRSASTGVFQLAEPPTGMYDPVRQERVLQGVRIRDVGDVLPDVGGRRQFSDAQALARRVTDVGKFLLVLGGDHSISAPIISGVSQAKGEIGVLHFDAHNDYSRPVSPETTGMHHGNFLNWVAGNEAVVQLLQCGIRQLSPAAPEQIDKRALLAGRQWLAEGGELLLDSMSPDIPWYITVDVDVIDPTLMSATGTPLPGGVTWEELTRTLELVMRNRTVVGLDVVEFLPDGSHAPGLEIAAMLVRVLDRVGGRTGTRW